MRIVLASASPRRKELLERAGVAFEVRASPAEELHDASIPLDELCERNAELKARAVAAADAVVIGADTLVWLEGEPLGKPADLGEARAMLRKLAGREHTVCSGVAMVFPDGRAECFHELTKVRFRDFGEETIDEYLSRVEVLDKAGSYGIQEHGELLVEGIEGGFDNVMGLPVDALVRRLSACGMGGA